MLQNRSRRSKRAKLSKPIHKTINQQSLSNKPKISLVSPQSTTLTTSTIFKRHVGTSRKNIDNNDDKQKQLSETELEQLTQSVLSTANTTTNITYKYNPTISNDSNQSQQQSQQKQLVQKKSNTTNNNNNNNNMINNDEYDYPEQLPAPQLLTPDYYPNILQNYDFHQLAPITPSSNINATSLISPTIEGLDSIPQASYLMRNIKDNPYLQPITTAVGLFRFAAPFDYSNHNLNVTDHRLWTRYESIINTEAIPTYFGLGDLLEFRSLSLSLLQDQHVSLVRRKVVQLVSIIQHPFFKVDDEMILPLISVASSMDNLLALTNISQHRFVPIKPWSSESAQYYLNSSISPAIFSQNPGDTQFVRYKQNLDYLTQFAKNLNLPLNDHNIVEQNDITTNTNTTTTNNNTNDDDYNLDDILEKEEVEEEEEEEEKEKEASEDDEIIEKPKRDRKSTKATKATTKTSKTATSKTKKATPKSSSTTTSTTTTTTPKKPKGGQDFNEPLYSFPVLLHHFIPSRLHPQYDPNKDQLLPPSKRFPATLKSQIKSHSYYKTLLQQPSVLQYPYCNTGMLLGRPVILHNHSILLFDHIIPQTPYQLLDPKTRYNTEIEYGEREGDMIEGDDDGKNNKDYQEFLDEYLTQFKPKQLHIMPTNELPKPTTTNNKKSTRGRKKKLEVENENVTSEDDTTYYVSLPSTELTKEHITSPSFSYLNHKTTTGVYAHISNDIIESLFDPKNETIRHGILVEHVTNSITEMLSLYEQQFYKGWVEPHLDDSYYTTLPKEIDLKPRLEEFCESSAKSQIKAYDFTLSPYRKAQSPFFDNIHQSHSHFETMVDTIDDNGDNNDINNDDDANNNNNNNSDIINDDDNNQNDINTSQSINDGIDNDINQGLKKRKNRKTKMNVTKTTTSNTDNIDIDINDGDLNNNNNNDPEEVINETTSTDIPSLALSRFKVTLDQINLLSNNDTTQQEANTTKLKQQQDEQQQQQQQQPQEIKKKFSHSKESLLLKLTPHLEETLEPYLDVPECLPPQFVFLSAIESQRYISDEVILSKKKKLINPKKDKKRRNKGKHKSELVSFGAVDGLGNEFSTSVFPKDSIALETTELASYGHLFAPNVPSFPIAMDSFMQWLYHPYSGRIPHLYIPNQPYQQEQILHQYNPTRKLDFGFKIRSTVTPLTITPLELAALPPTVRKIFIQHNPGLLSLRAKDELLQKNPSAQFKPKYDAKLITFNFLTSKLKSNQVEMTLMEQPTIPIRTKIDELTGGEHIILRLTNEQLVRTEKEYIFDHRHYSILGDRMITRIRTNFMPEDYFKEFRLKNKVKDNKNNNNNNDNIFEAEIIMTDNDGNPIETDSSTTSSSSLSRYKMENHNRPVFQYDFFNPSFQQYQRNPNELFESPLPPTMFILPHVTKTMSLFDENIRNLDYNDHYSNLIAPHTPLSFSSITSAVTKFNLLPQYHRDFHPHSYRHGLFDTGIQFYDVISSIQAFTSRSFKNTLHNPSIIYDVYSLLAEKRITADSIRDPIFNAHTLRALYFLPGMGGAFFRAELHKTYETALNCGQYYLDSNINYPKSTFHLLHHQNEYENYINNNNTNGNGKDKKYYFSLGDYSNINNVPDIPDIGKSIYYQRQPIQSKIKSNTNQDNNDNNTNNNVNVDIINGVKFHSGNLTYDFTQRSYRYQYPYENGNISPLEPNIRGHKLSPQFHFKRLFDANAVNEGITYDELDLSDDELHLVPENEIGEKSKPTTKSHRDYAKDYLHNIEHRREVSRQRAEQKEILSRVKEHGLLYGPSLWFPKEYNTTNNNDKTDEIHINKKNRKSAIDIYGAEFPATHFK